MKTVEEVLAEQQQKRDDKNRILRELNQKRLMMEPFELFYGVKDNPLPYEQKYKRNQLKLKEEETGVKLPVIKGTLKKQKAGDRGMD